MATSPKKPKITAYDIDLCFKALGLSPDASPVEVDKAYSDCMERFRQDMRSADPKKIQRTKENMDKISDLYFRVRKSEAYADRLKRGVAAGTGKEPGTGKIVMAALALVILAGIAAIVTYLLR